MRYVRIRQFLLQVHCFCYFGRVSISDSSLCLLHALRVDHCCKNTLRQAILFASSCRIPAAVSISVLRNVMQSVGLSGLSCTELLGPLTSWVTSPRCGHKPHMLAVIEVVLNNADTSLPEHPLHCIGNCIEYYRRNEARLCWIVGVKVNKRTNCDNQLWTQLKCVPADHFTQLCTARSAPLPTWLVNLRG